MEATAPWLTIIIQAGSFGLIVFIVTVMWPRSQKEAREERESRDRRFETMIEALHAKFSDRNDKLVATIESQTERLLAAGLMVCPFKDQVEIPQLKHLKPKPA